MYAKLFVDQSKAKNQKNDIMYYEKLQKCYSWLGTLNTLVESKKIDEELAEALLDEINGTIESTLEKFTNGNTFGRR